MKKYLLFFIIFICTIHTVDLAAQTNEDCMMCHEDKELTKERKGKTVSLFVNIKKYSASAHGRKKCISCHTDARGEDFPHAENLKKINCGECHGDMVSSEEVSVHQIFKDSGNIPDCNNCHGADAHTLTKSSTVTNKAKTYCNQCHSFPAMTKKYHQSNKMNTSCSECHTDNKHKEEISKSVHASLVCTNCHGYVANNIDDHATKPDAIVTADCYMCHNEIANEHKESIHGISIAQNVQESAQCWDCHGSHNITKVSDKQSMAHGSNLVVTCGKCHDSEGFAREHELSIKMPGILYEKSVHGKLVKEGNKNSATCVSCHGVHNIKNRIQPNSTIAAVNLANTCSQCHKEIAEEYNKSIHWIGVKKGVRNAPTCNDCHSEHNIHSITGNTNHDKLKIMQEQTCLQCHNNMIMAERYGLESKSATNYLDSYHGLAFLNGDENAAMCTDCHGVHKILPAYHKESTVGEANIVATCKKCHDNASEVFSKSYSHGVVENTATAYAINLATNIYFWLILIVIGGMVVHNLIIFRHDLVEKRRRSKNEIKIPRFTTNELIQHTVLLVSFILLAATGFNLKYSDAGWSQLLHEMGFTESYRQLLHRFSAVVMVVLSVYHFIYLVVTRRGRFVLGSLFPRLSDITQAFTNVKYYLGISKKHPNFDNYNYIEKAEYWALVWGTVLMGITGLFLWFPTLVGEWAPVWFIKVCEVVHFYEAILATLAIIVWHWFFVMFRPKEYPLNFACIDGKMTMEHYKEEHRLRFYKVVAEYKDVAEGRKTELSYFSRFIVAALEKNNVDVAQFIDDEINKDPQLQAYLQKKSE